MQTTVITFSRAHENEVPTSQKDMRIGRGELTGKEKGVRGRRERCRREMGLKMTKKKNHMHIKEMVKDT